MGNSSKSEVELGIQTTTMAIREELMSYFKGTCIERLANNHVVTSRSVDEGHGRYQYERRQQENERPRRIYVGNIPILTLRHATDRITFHNITLERSPQLRQIKAEVERFVEKFLVGVEKEYSDAIIA